MSTHLTKLMRRLAGAGLKPEFCVFVAENRYTALITKNGRQHIDDWHGIGKADTPESAIEAAVKDAIFAKQLGRTEKGPPTCNT